MADVMRVLVCGGRDFDDKALLFRTLDPYASAISCIVHGAARGADSLAGHWANTRYIREEPYPADWKKHGRAAGPIRNKQMLSEGKPDLVIAFPGGRGTANMVQQAEAYGVPVKHIAAPPQKPSIG